MTQVLRPRLRDVESFPVNRTDGEVHFALRDPDGFASSIVIPYPAAVLASLMNGDRTLAEIQDAVPAAIRRAGGAGRSRAADLPARRAILPGERALSSPLETRSRAIPQQQSAAGRPCRRCLCRRSPSHCSSNSTPSFFPPPARVCRPAWSGPPALAEPAAGDRSRRRVRRLLGVLSPHIDLRRGGPAFAWAYQRLVDESDADLFVIFGTAHSPMRYLFSALRKHFDTPLGTVETDLAFVNRLSANLKKLPGGADVDLFASDLAHRYEHSIEFQVLFLQYLLGGRRPFKIVPILTGSFHSFIAEGRQPRTDAAVSAFSEAMRQTAAQHCTAENAGPCLLHQRRRPGPHRPAIRRSATLESRTARCPIRQRPAPARRRLPGRRHGPVRRDRPGERRQSHLWAFPHLHDARGDAAPPRRAFEVWPGGRARRHFLRQFRQCRLLRPIRPRRRRPMQQPAARRRRCPIGPLSPARAIL